MDNSQEVRPLKLVNRRDVVAGATGAVALTMLPAPTLARGKGQWVEVRGSQATPAVTTGALTEAERTTLAAAVDRIFPVDEYGPSGTEAGVDVYIDRSLADLNAGMLPLVQAGLAALDGAAAGSFASATPEDQDAALTSAEAGKLEGDPGGFFGALLELSRQGMFSDPIHGGNANFAGWDLIGYSGIKLVWSEEDQALNHTPEPAHTSVEQYQGEDE